MKVIHNVDCSNCVSCMNENRQGFQYKKYVKDKKIDIHSRSNHDMFFILSGSLRISYEEVDDFACNSNQIILLLSNYNYKIEFTDDSEILMLKYTASIQLCNKLGIDPSNNYLNNISYKFHSLEMRGHMVDSMKLLAKCLNDGVMCSYIHEAKQIELFVLFMHYYTLEEIYGFFYKSIRNDIRFYTIVMEKHIYARNVEELASMCGYGLSNFKRLFYKHFNQSPYKWMMQQTAKRLHERLLDSKTPIKAIVSEFHFTDQSHLGSYCKRYLGATPTQIRQGQDKRIF